jgi:hypothetical protein
MEAVHASETSVYFYETTQRNLPEGYVRFQVLTAAIMKMTAFWDIAPCSLIEGDRRFRGVYCHHQGDRPSFQKAVILIFDFGWKLESSISFSRRSLRHVA